MKKINKFLVLLVFISLKVNEVNAQTIILNETLLTQESFDKFTVVSVTGYQNWYFRSPYGAACSGYSGGQSFNNEDWLISPSMNLSNISTATLTFEHTRGNAAVMDVGVEEGWYKAFATIDYTGNPETTQWVELDKIDQELYGAWQFISSGELYLPDEVRSANTRIAFRYISVEPQSATWQIKNVLVKGELNSSNEEDVFKIATWNVEHFGSTCNGPVDDELQMSNVVSAILALNADIVCLQEVTESYDYPIISNLVSVLGNEWGGTIIASDPISCSQNQGLIYKKSKVQYVNSSLLSSGSSSQGNSYSYNWSNGRYPVLYNVNLIVGNELIPVSLINIHAKAFGDEKSYTRRKGASDALKKILDGSQYNSKNVIIIGDFNDYLLGSSCYSCGDSPYINFMDDTDSYMGLSQYLQDGGCSYYPRTVDNMIISNELFDEYVTNSTTQETALEQKIYDYCSTTSDHLPVSALFRFSVTNDVDNVIPHNESLLNIYPNPVKDELKINSSFPLNNQSLEIYDLTGKKVFREKLNKNTINVSALPIGVYILKVGDYREKFAKQ